MARPAGSPKTPGSGRQKGTPNKYRVDTRAQLQAFLDSRGINVFETLVTTMLTTTDEKVKVQCATVIADRLMPRLKAVELSGDPDKPLSLQLTPEQRQARIAALLAQRNGHAEDTP